MKITIERTGPDFLGRKAWKVSVDPEGETGWQVTVGDEDPPVRYLYAGDDALDLVRAAMLAELEAGR